MKHTTALPTVLAIALSFGALPALAFRPIPPGKPASLSQPGILCCHS